MDTLKFLKLHFSSLRNEEWFQFFTEFRDLVNKYSAEKLDIVALFLLFMMLYDDADTALEVIRKSVETALMDKADQKRDRTFRGFIDAVKSALNHFDAEKQKAANELLVLLNHFGNLAEKTPNEETASIYNFLQELRGAYAPQIATLVLNDWITELDNNNQAYEELVKKRNVEVTSRTTLRMVDVRKKTQDVYRSIIERIEALIVVNGESQYAAFVTELNGYIKRYKL
ncbi:MAG: DUF6261 family protein [Prevotellaceae bacterium]|jgi:hypothetical protein|nr:DUF6261 family protein [Prevotellaceae bacterium]